MKEVVRLVDEYKEIVALLLSCKASSIKFYTKSSVSTIRELDHSSRLTPDGNFFITEILVMHEDKFILKKQNLISSFKLYQMPHCCAFIISCNVTISSMFSGKHVGGALNRFRVGLAKALGYASIICTDIEHNERQRKILKRNEWIDVHNVVNKRTGNTVFISLKDCNDD